MRSGVLVSSGPWHEVVHAIRYSGSYEIPLQSQVHQFVMLVRRRAAGLADGISIHPVMYVTWPGC